MISEIMSTLFTSFTSYMVYYMAKAPPPKPNKSNTLSVRLTDENLKKLREEYPALGISNILTDIIERHLNPGAPTPAARENKLLTKLRTAGIADVIEDIQNRDFSSTMREARQLYIRPFDLSQFLSVGQHKEVLFERFRLKLHTVMAIDLDQTGNLESFSQFANELKLPKPQQYLGLREHPYAVVDAVESTSDHHRSYLRVLEVITQTEAYVAPSAVFLQDGIGFLFQRKSSYSEAMEGFYNIRYAETENEYDPYVAWRQRLGLHWSHMNHAGWYLHYATKDLTPMLWQDEPVLVPPLTLSTVA